MKISSLQYAKEHRGQNIKKLNPQQFCGLKTEPQNICDIFQKSNQGLKELSGFFSGKFGTQCKGSRALESFFDTVKEQAKELIERGQSTNKEGFAFSFLKTNADNPISTSEVRDCSVMYLHNENKNTHFLFHLYKNTFENDVEYIIKTFMPENFSSAALVPGIKNWVSRHETYLPDVFNAIKNYNPKAPINVFHFSSNMPEIVGYRGKIYEISNKTHGRNGQATFKIHDLRTYNDLYAVERCDRLQDLKILSEIIKKEDYDKEIKKILYNLITKRKAIIKEIQSCKTSEELDKISLKYEGSPYWNLAGVPIRGYDKVIERQSYKIAESKNS